MFLIPRNLLGVLLRCSVILSLATLSDTAKAWDPIRDVTGKSLNNHVKGAIRRTDNSIKKFLHNPVDYTLDLPVKILTQVCSAPAQTYENFLRGQANGWHKLPPQLIEAVQDAYSVNLKHVEYTTNSSTPSGNAITFGNRIYFPGSVNLYSESDLFWMLHELEHTVQYAGATYGKSGKICEYMAHGVGAGLQHDNISMEQAADRKANALLPLALAAMSGQLPLFKAQYLGLDKNEIYFENLSGQDVVFYLESPSTAVTEHRLAAGANGLFYTDAPDDRWNVFINTNGTGLRYTVPGGTHQVIDWNQRGLLDVFYRPIASPNLRPIVSAPPPAPPTPIPPPSPRQLSGKCLFQVGPRTGTFIDYTLLGYPAIPIGSPCNDGVMSQGVVVP